MTDGNCRLRLPDGRILAWADYGSREGKPLLLLHGTPGSRVLLGALGTAARDFHVRLIAPDRPGYGRSDPDPRSGFLSYCTDLLALLDHLGLARVTVGGISGGAGYAVAAAHRLADRLHAALVISGMTVPLRTHRPSAGTHRAEAFLARYTPGLLGAGFGVAARTGRRGLRLATWAWPAPDRSAAREPGLAGALAADFTEALRQGGRVAARELQLYHTTTLDIPAHDIVVPIDVLHGARDTTVPLAAAERLCDAIPTATLTVLPDAGHLLAFTEPGQVLGRVRPLDFAVR